MSDEFPKVIEFQGSRVKIYKRQNDLYALSWRDQGARRTTTVTGEKEALSRAAALARRLAQSIASQWISESDSERLQLLKSIARKYSDHPEPATQLRALLADLERAIDILGDPPDLVSAATWFRDHGPLLRDPISLREAGQRFLAEYQHSSKDTRRLFSLEINALSLKHGDLYISQMTEEMLSAWTYRNTTTGAPPAPRTILSRIATITTFSNRLKDWGYLPPGSKSAIERVKRPRIPDAGREILSIDQARDLITAVREHSPRLELYLIIAGWIGLRPSEIQRVIRSNIDLDRGYLHCTTDIVQKTFQERFVPIDARLIPRLKILIEEKAPNQRLCAFTARERLSKLAREQGILQTWPSDVLRHSFCSYRLAILGDIQRVADEAGNSPSMIRSHYRRPLRPEDGEAWWNLL